jgi:short subunit dehydrogenase-like uncharacterized protein
MSGSPEALTQAQRRFDVVLFGATGFTGQLTAEYLAKAAPSLRWALAGRSKEKLEAVRRSLAAVDGKLAALDLMVADAADPAALALVAKKARVVCTTVGPYLKYGRALAAACAEAGTHYCDLTGETTFVRASIDENHARAQATGARIVHCCGFDSIPSDLGTFMLAGEYKVRGRQLARADFFVGPMRGAASGGTIASMLAIFEQAATDRSVRRLAGDPYALLPDRKQDRGPDGGDQLGVRFEERLGEWTGPFVMAAINTRIVRRSNALLGFSYGRQFRYSEAMSLGRGPRGLVRSSALTAGLGALVAAASTGLGRKLLGKLLPAPGEGPDKAARDAGFFRVRILGEAEGEPAMRLVARVEGKSDPGYGETAKMLGESALCLALDGAALPAAAGVLTPASAMGAPLLARLRAAGMVFSVSEAAEGGR